MDRARGSAASGGGDGTLRRIWPALLLVLLSAVVVGLLAGLPGTPAGAQEVEPEQQENPAADPPEDPWRSPDYPNWRTVEPGTFGEYNQRSNLIQRGRKVYAKYCIGCHGEYGQGDGPAAVRLITQPRDFTSGIYKFRSTDSSSLPMEYDLYRTISRGLARVSMPAFPLMPEREKVAVIEYIKTLYPRWDERKGERTVVPVPGAPHDLLDPRRILRGRVVYVEMQCGQCHGIDGQGTGATRTEYVDAWGNEQKPFNFTRGSLKGGNDPEDIYRTFHTGLQSIMPSYGGETLALVTVDLFESMSGTLTPDEVESLRAVLDEFPADSDALYSDLDDAQRAELALRNSWDLVAFILSLRTPMTTADAVLGPAARNGESSR